MALLKIEYLQTARLIPYVNNSNTHSDKQVESITESIREFGFTQPILIDESEGVIAGHGRLLAAQVLEMDEVPCIRLSHLSERQRRAYVIADNKLARLSTWDFEKLSQEMDYLVNADFDLEVTGFSEDEIDALMKSDRDILPPTFTEPETITVGQHERKVGEAKPKVYEWRVLVEASSKSDAKKKRKELEKLGYTCVLLKDGDS